MLMMCHGRKIMKAKVFIGLALLLIGLASSGYCTDDFVLGSDDMPLNNSNFRVLEISVLVQSVDGELYRIAKNYPTDGSAPNLSYSQWSNPDIKTVPVGMTDGIKEFVSEKMNNGTVMFLSLIEKIETQYKNSVQKIDQLIQHIQSSGHEVKVFWHQTEKNLLMILTIIGVIAIFVATGFISFFVNTSFPIFPQKYIFYVIFVLICGIWAWLTSLYTSSVCSILILMIPHSLLFLINKFIQTKKNGHQKSQPKKFRVESA